MKKVLVTGGAGYIGSTLVPELLKLGYKVTVLDIFMYGQNSLLECCANENFDVVKGDVRDESVVKPLLKNVDYIIPLAALVGAPLCNRDKVGAVTINNKQGINRRWQISTENPLTGSRNVTYSWVSADDNNANLNFAKVWNSSNGSTNWNSEGAMQNVSTTHSITVPVTAFNHFTVNSASTINLPNSFSFDEDDNRVVDLTAFIDGSSKRSKVKEVDLYFQNSKQTQIIKGSSAKDYNIFISGNTNIQYSIEGNSVTFWAGENWFGSEVLTITLNEVTKNSKKREIEKKTANQKIEESKATYYDTVEINVIADNDAPQIVSFFPTETTITTSSHNNNFSMDVADIDNVYGDLSFEWYINDILQEGAVDSVFTANIPSTGEYTVKGMVTDGEYYQETIWAVNANFSSIAELALPLETKLSQNYPNPFNPETIINYSLKEEVQVILEIYNHNGQLVKSLVNGVQRADYYAVHWNGSGLPSGIYFYKMKAGNYTIVKKAMIVK